MPASEVPLMVRPLSSTKTEESVSVRMKKTKFLNRPTLKFKAFGLVNPDKGKFIFRKKTLKCLLVEIGPVCLH
jgi:hypothetical protein